MIVGIGVDVVENVRFVSPSIGLIKRLFTQYEIACSENVFSKDEYFASRFAAKEAFVKALGSGFRGISSSDIEIRNNSDGMPYIVLLNGKEIDLKIHLSISHEKSVSIAMVVVEDGTK